jgi:formylglycine-generating enzyme
MKIHFILVSMILLSVLTLSAKPMMVRLEGGSMNAWDPEYGYYDSVNQVEVPSFDMAVYEVTVGDFTKFVEKTKYKTTAELVGYCFGYSDGTWEYTEGMNWQNPGYEQNEDYPVACLSWYDAISYCNWLSKQDKLKPVYKINANKPDPNNTNVEDTQKWTVTANWKANGYRLPTVAEWEYAARNGGQDITRFWDGIDLAYDLDTAPANISDESINGYSDEDYEDYEEYDYGLGDYYTYDDGYVYAAPVGSYQPDDLGLMDIAGNITEWCWNWESDDYFTGAYSNDLHGPDSGVYRNRRGPDWTSGEDELDIPLARSVNTDYPAYQYFGMRLAKNPGKSK